MTSKTVNSKYHHFDKPVATIESYTRHSILLESKDALSAKSVFTESVPKTKNQSNTFKRYRLNRFLLIQLNSLR